MTTTNGTHAKKSSVGLWQPLTSPAQSPTSPTSPVNGNNITNGNGKGEPLTLTKALNNNVQWCSSISASNPSYFPQLAKGQSPTILWLGCSDSRVPAETILSLAPGEIFVHRNIANIITSSDLSSASVIEFAVAVLKVKIVVVCGHTKCGGVAAALGNKRIGVIDTWLAPLRSTRMRMAGELEKCKSDAEKSDLMVSENVKASVRAVRENPYVIDAIRERGMEVHGLVFDLESGRLKEVEVDEPEEEKKARVGAFETS